MLKYVCEATNVLSFVLFSCCCHGQIELSGGIELGYPELLNSNYTLVNSGQITYGLRGGIAWRPVEAAFFPSLDAGYGRTRLPLQASGINVAALDFNYANATLNENYAVMQRRGQLLLSAGIGFSYLTERAITRPGSAARTVQASIDSAANISKVFPAMGIGVAYDFGASAEKHTYVTIGVSLQYKLLPAGRNTYYINVTETGNSSNNYQAGLTGNLFIPGFYVVVHYKVRKNKSGMYL